MSQSKAAFLRSRLMLATLVACGALGVSACSDKSATGSSTTGEKVDAAIAKTEQAATDAKNKTEEVASDLKAKLEASGASGASTANQGVADAKDSAHDASTSVSETVGDAAITAAVSAGLVKDADLSAIKIDVDTQRGVVTLNGPAPTAAAKARAEEIAKSVKGVTSVDNKLEVKPG